MNASPDPIVLMFTAAPELRHLEAALADAGLPTMRVTAIETARQILTAHRGAAIAVLDTSPDAPYSVDSAYRLLHQSTPVPTLLLLTRDGDSSLHAESVSALDDYAYLDDSGEELVRRAQVLSRRAALAAPVATGLGFGAVQARFQRGQTVVVYAPKGGVGKSTIAVNLAIGLTRLFHKDVALVDADLWFGDASVLLDVRARQSMTSLVASATDLDVEAIKSALVEHPAGFQVLRAPTDLMAVDEIPEYVPARLAVMCASMFDFVVVDGQPGLDEYMLQVLEGASQIVLVLTPELAVMRSTIRVLEVAPSLGWADKVLLVLNRADSGVPLREVEDAIGRPIDVTIETAWRRMIDAGNYGEPIMLTDPAGREQVTRDLGRLAARVAGEPEPNWASQMPAWRRVLGGLGMRLSSVAKSKAPALVKSEEPAPDSQPEHQPNLSGDEPTNGHRREGDWLQDKSNGRQAAPHAADDHTVAVTSPQARRPVRRNGAADRIVTERHHKTALIEVLPRTPHTGQEGGATRVK
jgi:pilus assembly protein CpaE